MMVRRALLLLVALCVAAACSEGEGSLFIELRTDLAPVAEFAAIRTELLRATDGLVEPGTSSELAALRSLSFPAGVRIAEHESIEARTWVVRVQLIDADGAVVAERDTIVELSGSFALTVVITRDCIGVECPSAGGSASAIACLGGACVDPSCIPGRPETGCPDPECSPDVPCSGGGVACISEVCADGVCLEAADPDGCPSAGWCDPSGGCRPLPACPGCAIAQLTAGVAHTCALYTSGRMTCWGANGAGQLGDGTTTERPTPVDVSAVPEVVQITAGHRHTCAVDANGDAWCWGRGGNGALGNGSRTDAPTPVMIASGVARIGSGARHTCAVRADGTVACWGDGSSGQLGNGATVTVDVPNAVAAISGATDVDGGELHTCVVHDSLASCWGNSAAGMLGDGTFESRSSPGDVVMLVNVAQLVLGRSFTCARGIPGLVACWGANGMGQLGRGSAGPNDPFTASVGLSAARELAAGVGHVCAMNLDGSLSCWGGGVRGQLGFGSLLDVPSPTVVSGLGNVVTLAAGETHTCVGTDDGAVSCWGRNSRAQLGDGTLDTVLAPVTVSGISNVAAITAGRVHACALLGTNDVMCWGVNRRGQLGDGSNTPSSTPVLTNLVGVVGVELIDAGDHHTCAVMMDGTMQCWGEGNAGELGDGTGSDSSTPVVVSGLIDIAGVAAGQHHTCARRIGGTVTCWGEGGRGALGDGMTMTTAAPTRDVVGITDAISIAAGQSTSCAVQTGGGVSCWGANDLGQLGDGTTMDSAVPVDVAGLPMPVSRVVASRETFCAIHVDRTVSCWGQGGGGLIGGGASTETSSVPPTSPGLTLVSAIAGGHEHFCAVHGSPPRVSCWGDGEERELGPDPTDANAPREITGTTDAAAVAVGQSFSCAAQSGNVVCWGSNGVGQLGNGESLGTHAPALASLVPVD